MATRRPKTPSKVGRKLRPLYPSGWPSNMKAVLYLNNKRRDRNLSQ